ncbi:15-hydroxyprostaglandin dehydrogenase [NAD(+)]-like isoform X1 [Penaeus chinensis]|uniref:15-hydroxyprostaglandin dehydrogenase [NAD(+)]-like isoform X1 n=2 Tax=Penaeus chinensis TaxID=139456 RepID=UPI001FB760F8|nr:15-hydroxyprostaglandin dehydrogenase [NAD(+)]-like isoform X1 [Penaeus chinensis]XP_047501474.1 15-hydroxyprostaglandin dehydrogenase [NAD(+)]-like isoform X1 [Penaeus chinensis]XP_047501475.1 15-hydroxyprostaglandin dehydrogenase [NAD(+)]-like isoform X1 [Penaeus chinensis]
MGGCCSRTKTLETAVQRPPVAMQIQGSVVLITGAARGLGRCFAETLLARGAKVCLTDIDADAGAEAVAELQAQHGSDNAMFFKCDVTKDEDFNGAWDAAVEKFGPVTLLVNNAGLGNEQNWQLTLNVNIGGCTRGTLLALERMGVSKGGAGGSVVNVSSITGLKPAPFGPIYCATKHAIVGLTRSLGHAFHHSMSKVTVQALCPSLVKTDLLANSSKTAFSPEVAAAMLKLGGSIKIMTPEYVSAALVKLIEEGPNGGCMAVEADKEPYLVEPPIPL